MNYKAIRLSFFPKLYTALVILFPILSIYGKNQIHLGMILMLLSVLMIIIFEKRISMKWPKYFMLFFIFMVVTRILDATDLSFSSLFSLSLVSFTLFLGFSCRYFDLDFGLRIYKIVALSSSFFFFFQELMYLFLDYRLVGLLPFLPLNMAAEITTVDFISWLSVSTRSASFFLEPAHFSQYITPLLAFVLFKNKGQLNFYTILISAVILFQRSGTGILILALIWITWFLVYIKNITFVKKLIIFIFIIPVISFSVYIYIKSDLGQKMFERTTEFDEISATTSGYVRTVRGFHLFSEFPTSNKYLGMNSPIRIKSFINQSSMYNLFQENDLLFSGIQSILIYGGFFGMFLFLIHFYYMFIKNSIEGKMVAFTFIGLSLISPIYLMGEMLLCYTIIYSLHRKYLALID